MTTERDASGITPGMATTGTNPDSSTRRRLDQLPRQTGTISPASSSSAESPGATAPSIAALPLNPRFSLWLMGYPVGWLD